MYKTVKCVYLCSILSKYSRRLVRCARRIFPSVCSQMRGVSARPTRHQTHSGIHVQSVRLVPSHIVPGHVKSTKNHIQQFKVAFYMVQSLRERSTKPPKLSGTESTIVPLTQSSRSRLESTQKPIQQL
jgi:hypothetical protein